MSVNPKEFVGEQLKKYRENLGETQEVFAKRLFINRSTLSLIEKGTQAPDLDLLIRIIKITKINPYILLNIEYKRNVIVAEDIISDKPQRFRDDIQKMFDKVYIPDIIIRKYHAYKEGTESQKTSAEYFFDFFDRGAGSVERLETQSKKEETEIESIIKAANSLTKDFPDDMFYLLTDDYSAKFFCSESNSNFKVINSSQYLEMFKEEYEYDNPKSQRFFDLVKERKLDEASSLLSENINVNHVDGESGLTPLIYVIRQGDIKAFDWLLSIDGIDINALDDQKHRLPPISHAIRADIPSEDEKTYMVRNLIEHGANVNEPSKSDLNWFNTPLMIASWHGCLEIVKILVENGACLDQQDKGNGFTPLIKAIINCHFDVAEYLIEQGANPSIYAHNSKYFMKKAIDIAYEKNINNQCAGIIGILKRSEK